MKHTTFTRRDFLKNTASMAAGALYLSLPGHQLPGARAAQSRVVLIRRQNLLDNLNRPDEHLVQQMLDEAVMALFDVSTPADAWKQVVRPADVVGIKTNVWHYLPTPPALNKSIETRVREAGVSENNISTRDRGLRNDPVFMKGTALINVRPMRSHHWAGVGTLIKNYIIFTEQPSAHHPDSCADLAAIWKRPEIAGKTRLNILVMFTPLFHGIGPHHFSPQYIWPYQGLLVGTDPVAVDATGVRIIQAKRTQHFGEERPLNPPPRHIFLADTRHHLGTADPNKIDLIRLGWQQDSLI